MVLRTQVLRALLIPDWSSLVTDRLEPWGPLPGIPRVTMSVMPGRLGLVLPRSLWSQTTSLFFKVTPAHWMSSFDPKKFVCTLSLENKDGFRPKLGQLKDLIRFWWPWPNFQGHHTMKTVKVSLVYTLLPEPINGFWLNLHRNTIGTRKRSD